MISFTVDPSLNTNGLIEMANIFEPFFDEDINITIVYDDSSITMTASGETRTVDNHNKTADFKLCMYRLLSSLSNVTLPWGSLTGVKPLKRYYSSYESNNFDNEATRSDLKLNYELSDEKITLLEKTVMNQKDILYPEARANALYIHIPMCPSKCSYCSFPSAVVKPDDPRLERYIDCVIKELEAIDRYNEGSYYDCVYIGGGTPSVLTPKLLEKLLKKVNVLAPKATEICVEAGRSDTTDDEKLKIMKDNLVTRVSLNPQTTCDRTLEKVNRRLTNDDFLRLYERASRYDFDSINCDLIMGLEGEEESDFEKSLNDIIRLDPDNITLHALAAKRSAQVQKEEIFNNKKNVSLFMDHARKVLCDSGYDPYYLYRQKYCVSNSENTGFSKPGKQCIYNLRMMGDTQTILSAGANAATKIYFKDEDRFENVYNVKELSLYLDNIDNVIDKKIRQIDKIMNSKKGE